MRLPLSRPSLNIRAPGVRAHSKPGCPGRTTVPSAAMSASERKPARALAMVGRMKSNTQEKRARETNLRVLASAGDTYEWSKVLLARAHADGSLELLTGAWALALGYGREELSRKTLGELMGSADRAAALVAAILDDDGKGAVQVKLRCRDGKHKHFHLHRRHDEYECVVFLVAEETGPRD